MQRRIDRTCTCSTITAAGATARRRRGMTAGLALATLALMFAIAPDAQATKLTVGTLGDPGPSLQLSLREAVLMARQRWRHSSIRGGSQQSTITLLHGEISITQALTIQGPGPDLIRVDGNQKSRIFNISNASATVIDVTIDGLTLTGGSVIGDNGGAILSNGANLTISNCAIVSNSASGAGGGLSIGGSNWTVTGTLVRGNASGSNGGSQAHSMRPGRCPRRRAK